MLLSEFIRTVRAAVTEFEADAARRHEETPQLVPAERGPAMWWGLLLEHLNRRKVVRR